MDPRGFNLDKIHGSHQLSVLLNQGGGKFTTSPVCDIGHDPFAVAVADVNRDRRNDLVAA